MIRVIYICVFYQSQEITTCFFVILLWFVRYINVEKPEGAKRMNNPETPTTLRTQYTRRRQEQINKQTTEQNKKTNKKHEKRKTTQKTKEMSNTGSSQNMGWNQVLQRGKQFLFLIEHSPCYSYSQDVLHTSLRKQTQTAYRRDEPPTNNGG